MSQDGVSSPAAAAPQAEDSGQGEQSRAYISPHEQGESAAAVLSLGKWEPGLIVTLHTHMCTNAHAHTHAHTHTHSAVAHTHRMNTVKLLGSRPQPSSRCFSAHHHPLPELAFPASSPPNPCCPAGKGLLLQTPSKLWLSSGKESTPCHPFSEASQMLVCEWTPEWMAHVPC